MRILLVAVLLLEAFDVVGMLSVSVTSPPCCTYLKYRSTCFLRWLKSRPDRGGLLMINEYDNRQEDYYTSHHCYRKADHVALRPLLAKLILRLWPPPRRHLQHAQNPVDLRGMARFDHGKSHTQRPPKLDSGVRKNPNTKHTQNFHEQACTQQRFVCLHRLCRRTATKLLLIPKEKKNAARKRKLYTGRRHAESTRPHGRNLQALPAFPQPNPER